MLRSRYSRLEVRSQMGATIVVLAILINLAGSIISMAGLLDNPFKMVVPLLLLLGLSVALYLGKGWARWIMIAWNVFGGGFTLFFVYRGQLGNAGFFVGRAAICAVVAILLLLPSVRDYIRWKKMRF